MAKDFQLFYSTNDSWVENVDSFDFVIGSNTEFVFKLQANRELKDININFKTEEVIPIQLAIVDSLESVRVFTEEDTYVIPSLGNDKNKFLVIKLNTTKTGYYKVLFSFDYLVK